MSRHRKKMAVWIVVAAGMLALPAPGGETSPVPWTLDFDLTKLGSISVPVAPGRAETVWYALFTVSNATGAERPLALHFRVETDTRKTSFETVDPEGERLLERRLGRKLVSAGERPASLGDGERIEGVAFLGAIDPRFDRLSISVTGLRDVVYRVGRKRFYEKRARVFEFSRPGDEYFVRREPVKLVKKSWKTLEGPREIR